jgi:hypothetical protein
MSVADLERISYPPLSLRPGGGRWRRVRLALIASWRAGALLTDGTSSLYRPTEPGALGSRLRAAAAALEPPAPGGPARLGQEAPG